MFIGKCGLIWKRCMPEIIFSKKESQIWYFESFIFWSKFRFWGQLLGVLASVFLIFLSLGNHGGRQFYSCIPGHISFQAKDHTRHNIDHKQCEWLVAFFSRGWDSTWVDFESSVFMWRDLDLALLYITFGQTLLEMILGLKCDFFSCLSFVPIHHTQSMLLLHSM